MTVARARPKTVPNHTADPSRMTKREAEVYRLSNEHRLDNTAIAVHLGMTRQRVATVLNIAREKARVQ